MHLKSRKLVKWRNLKLFFWTQRDIFLLFFAALFLAYTIKRVCLFLYKINYILYVWPFWSTYTHIIGKMIANYGLNCQVPCQSGSFYDPFFLRILNTQNCMFTIYGHIFLFYSQSRQKLYKVALTCSFS